MTHDRYVVLTGGKKNAGDHLIKYKALRLFKAIRPDREVVALDPWKPLSTEDLQLINESKALILTGGPALQGNMYPGVYPLVDDLDQIKVPILTMGIGYKEESGHWHNTAQYPLSASSIKLLKRIETSGYKSSVRDYHTLNALLHKGFKSFVMSGCPALYEVDQIKQSIKASKSFQNIAFSLGVSFIQSDSMRDQMRSLMLAIKHEYSSSKFVVYFHHTIDLNQPKQEEMVNWLKQNNISFEDISATEKMMVETYQSCDIHIGYRVHAHIHASSMGVPSILINEDSRGKGFYTVMGGLVIDGYYSLPRFNRPAASTFYKMLGAVKKISDKLGLIPGLEAYEHLSKDVLFMMKYELEAGHPRTKVVRSNIDIHFEEMKKFLLQLP
jgi:exopolysaccharide biosynthesis predicted pyruvyltransferase EpsI